MIGAYLQFSLPLDVLVLNYMMITLHDCSWNAISSENQILSKHAHAQNKEQCPQDFYDKHEATGSSSN